MMENIFRNSAWLYDLERDNDLLLADIPFYIEYANQQKGEILELGCGTGRVALELAQKGFSVTGLDLSRQMLDVFQGKLAARPELTDKVNIAHGSMADFSFDRKFALIIAPFRAFQAVTDDADINNTLTCVREHLADDGVFIVNVFKPYTVLDESWCRPEEEIDFEVLDGKTGNRVVGKSRRERINLENQIIYPYLVYEVTYPDGRTERIVDHLQLKYYYSPQLRARIEEAGLEIVDEFSWYDKQPPGGREIILVCRKNKTNPLVNHYSNKNEHSRLEAKHGQVEFLTTMHYIERFLTPGAKVLELGAGTGRYSRAIADKGYEVEAVELVPCNIETFKEFLLPEQKIAITQGNALDLHMFQNNTFDITLSLGPLYHLYTAEDKCRAISEALRVTKPGGVVLVAYCMSDATIVGGFNRKCFDIAEYIQRGKINEKTFETYSKPEDVFELVRKEDIDCLMNSFDVERLHYVATDLFTRYIRDAVNDMDEEEFAIYLRYHFAVCERADMAGITHHSLDIFRKPR